MALVFAIVAAVDAVAGAVPDKGTLVLNSIPVGRISLDGFVGQRVKADVDHWLAVAPKNNPGLLGMFARRDSGTKPDLVPWAGEFVGKYLICGVQAMQMSDDPKLRETLAAVVARLIELQAEDGYLGPWPKNERLRGHWDLWGHYHVMLGLMLWSDQTGDKRAFDAARRIADLVCNTCLDTDFRVVNAGSHEMNMGIIHGLALIYQKTGEPRYLRMAKEVLKDFESAGDYYRTGLDGREFYRTPKPRWESLHSLQGLAELYRITGDDSFRTAFLNHWASMRRFDQRNTGGFSSGEQATGNPYANTAIETCCVVAWQEIMIDALRLTGDSTIADDLELSTLNAMLGAQHPSGAWCTYNTPMAGQRIPSHIHIRFQAREDTPHLNCCSVNGPRGYGSITRWGVMQHDNGLALNYYGPMTAEVKLADGTPVTIRQETDYPIGGTVNIKVEPSTEKQFTLALRIPAWSARTGVSVNGRDVPGAKAGRYFDLERTWKAGDKITLQLDMGVRYEAGDLDQYGNVSLYRGPTLLALDDRFWQDPNPPIIDVANLEKARLLPVDDAIRAASGTYPPWLVVELPSTAGAAVRLIDFASAGATTLEGKPTSQYTSWLPAKHARPPRPVAWKPADRSRVGSGPILFAWRKPASGAVAARKHTVVVSASPDFREVVLTSAAKDGSWLVLPKDEAGKLKPGKAYYWKVIARNEYGQSESLPPYKQFTIDPTVPPLSYNWPYGQREKDQMVTAAPLRGEIKPSYGVLADGKGWKPAPGPDNQPNTAIELDGTQGIVRYKLLLFPEDDYSVSIRLMVTRFPTTQYGQIFSAWCGGMDDPLRVVVAGDKLSARIEAGELYRTGDATLETGRWYHVAVVKQNNKLTLYVDGKAHSAGAAPAVVTSNAHDFALGGNPHFAGPEFLAARLADLEFFARALSAEEVKALCGE